MFGPKPRSFWLRAAEFELEGGIVIFDAHGLVDVDDGIVEISFHECRVEGDALTTFGELAVKIVRQLMERREDFSTRVEKLVGRQVGFWGE